MKEINLHETLKKEGSIWKPYGLGVEWITNINFKKEGSTKISYALEGLSKGLSKGLSEKIKKVLNRNGTGLKKNTSYENKVNLLI